MSQSNRFPNQDGGLFFFMFQFIYRVHANVRKQPRRIESGGGREEKTAGGSEGGESKKNRSSRRDLRLRNGTRKNESRGGRRSPSRKRSIQKLNSASSSKIRIQRRGVTAQERLDKWGESFISSSRKGNEKYRRVWRLTGQQFFFLTELPYSTPQS